MSAARNSAKSLVIGESPFHPQRKDRVEQCRLEADAKALWAYYRYGVLHGCVRLRWGFLDEWIGARWALPGDRRLIDLIREAEETQRALEVVAGYPPSWSDPWGRATAVQPVRSEPRGWVLVPVVPGAWSGALEEIFEARLAASP